MKYSKGSVPSNLKDMSGLAFGELTVVKREGSAGGKAAWVCECSCGNSRIITGDRLRQGQFSCGCKNKGNTTHGKSHTRTFSIWSGMKNRCNNSSNERYIHYGGRGIKVCPEWSNYEAFLGDMGECPKGYSIERIDVDGDYCLTNCKWIPLSEQSKNKRNTIKKDNMSVDELSEKYNLKGKTTRYRIKYNVPLEKRVGKEKIITHDGMSLSQNEWAEKLGVAHSTISMRIKRERAPDGGVLLTTLS